MRIKYRLSVLFMMLLFNIAGHSGNGGIKPKKKKRQPLPCEILNDKATQPPHTLVFISGVEQNPEQMINTVSANTYPSAVYFSQNERLYSYNDQPNLVKVSPTLITDSWGHIDRIATNQSSLVAFVVREKLYAFYPGNASKLIVTASEPIDELLVDPFGIFYTTGSQLYFLSFRSIPFPVGEVQYLCEASESIRNLVRHNKGVLYSVGADIFLACPSQGIRLVYKGSEAIEHMVDASGENTYFSSKKRLFRINGDYFVKFLSNAPEAIQNILTTGLGAIVSAGSGLYLSQDNGKNCILIGAFPKRIKFFVGTAFNIYVLQGSSLYCAPYTTNILCFPTLQVEHIIDAHSTTAISCQPLLRQTQLSKFIAERILLMTEIEPRVRGDITNKIMIFILFWYQVTPGLQDHQ